MKALKILVNHFHQLRGYSVLTVIHFVSPVFNLKQTLRFLDPKKVRAAYGSRTQAQVVSASHVEQGIERLLRFQRLPDIPN
jgi:hypothetical protein